MKRLSVFLCVVAFGLLMLIGVEAQAEIIPYSFQGTFQISNVPGISVGETFSGTLLYDNAATPTYSGGNFSDFDTTLAAITVTASEYTYEPEPASSVSYTTVSSSWLSGLLFPDGQYDRMRMGQPLTPNGDFPNTPTTNLWFADADQTVFTGNASVLPSSLLDGFDYVELVIGTQIESDEGLVNIWAKGLVSSFGDAQPVPEPATVLLLGTGLVGLVGFRKKLKK